MLKNFFEACGDSPILLLLIRSTESWRTNDFSSTWIMNAHKHTHTHTHTHTHARTRTYTQPRTYGNCCKRNKSTASSPTQLSQPESNGVGGVREWNVYETTQQPHCQELSWLCFHINIPASKHSNSSTMAAVKYKLPPLLAVLSVRIVGDIKF